MQITVGIGEIIDAIEDGPAIGMVVLIRAHSAADVVQAATE